MEFDTIAAIATPMGDGSISVIRVSGPLSLEIVDKIYKGKNKLSTVDSHTIHYGHIIDPGSDEIVDEVLISVMRAPRTFTKEDVVEISCHGGIVSTNNVLRVVLENGARVAEPGEFTKRAFLNGRIDLSQAEAVIDLIRSKTDQAMKVAVQQVEGKLSRLIKQLRSRLLEMMAHIEVTIDYPEHDVDEMTRQLLLDKSNEVKDEIKRLLQTAEQGKVLREGISTVIVGRPNVGKSSLLNSLVHENKAIVTEIPGTTRDVIEEYINIRGIPLRIVDTAGIRETEDIVEKIGVEKSRKALKDADLILLVVNNSEELSEEDRQLFEAVQGMNVIVIINKIDLPKKLNEDDLLEFFPDSPMIHLSVKEEKGITQLEEIISNLFTTGSLQAADLTYVSNSRHISLLKQALSSVDEAIEAVQSDVPVDMIAFDIKRSWELLGEIIGEEVHEDLIDQIFSQFCLGK